MDFILFFSFWHLFLALHDNINNWHILIIENTTGASHFFLPSLWKCLFSFKVLIEKIFQLRMSSTFFTMDFNLQFRGAWEHISQLCLLIGLVTVFFLQLAAIPWQWDLSHILCGDDEKMEPSTWARAVKMRKLERQLALSLVLWLSLIV